MDKARKKSETLRTLQESVRYGMFNDKKKQLKISCFFSQQLF